ncbi:MAG: hypothetical protein R3B09_13905 [Nannocystaceae bacterium]
MNDDDRLLHALGAIAREGDAREGAREAWERLAAGEGSIDDALAAGDPELSEAEARELAELLGGTGATGATGASATSAEAALVERMAGALAQGTGSMGPVLEARQDASPEGPPAPPIDLAQARARRRWFGVGGGALAAAAVVLLWLRSGDPVATVALPEYGLVARNQTVQVERGDPPAEGPARYQAASEIDWVLAPEEPIAAATAVAILVEGRGPAMLVRPPVERSQEGALRIRGRLGERLELPPGRYTLRFLIGPAEGLPEAPAEVDPALAGGVVREATPRYAIEILE